MKTVLLKSTSLLLVCALLFSCSSETLMGDSSEMGNSSANLSTKKITPSVDLSNEAKFVEFTQKLVDNLVEYSYYQKSKLGNNEEAFRAALSKEDLSPDDVEAIYKSYGLDFDQILEYETTTANLRLGLMYDYPELDEYTEEEMNELVLSEINDVIGGGIITVTNPISTNSITIDEIWYCAIEAAGFGFATSIGLKQLKKEGIKVITKAITKGLAKWAGPIGAAIAIADFGFCLYRADQD